MKNFLSGLIAASFALGLHANEGQITIVGKGEVEEEAQWASVALKVQSECFKNPSEAIADNDQKVSAISEVLNSLKAANEYDRVIVKPGLVAPFSRHRNYGDDSKVECKGTFQKTTHITFRTSDIKKFPSKYHDLQQEVRKAFTAADEVEAPRTYVEILSASADVCEKTRLAMSIQALNEAHDNAEAIFLGWAKKHKVEGYKRFTHKKDPDSTHERFASVESYMPKASFGEGDSEFVNVGFAPIKEHCTLPVTFFYDCPGCSVVKHQ